MSLILSHRDAIQKPELNEPEFQLEQFLITIAVDARSLATVYPNYRGSNLLISNYLWDCFTYDDTLLL